MIIILTSHINSWGQDCSISSALAMELQLLSYWNPFKHPSWIPSINIADQLVVSFCRLLLGLLLACDLPPVLGIHKLLCLAFQWRPRWDVLVLSTVLVIWEGGENDLITIRNLSKSIVICWLGQYSILWGLNTMPIRMADIWRWQFQMHFHEWELLIVNKISFNCVSEGVTDSKTILVLLTAWCLFSTNLNEEKNHWYNEHHFGCYGNEWVL